MFTDVIGRLPTIPEYFRQHINKDVDLESEPKQFCPFHEDKDSPSFSYSRERSVWRCFGGCKCGGDVIELHRKNFKFKSRKDAETSLKGIYQVYEDKVQNLEQEEVLINPEKIEFESVYQKALIMATNPKRWLELDYTMSIYPVEAVSLKDLIEKWENEKEESIC